ncbi:MAG: hypothetical protein Q7R33_05225 [Nitrosarchaeum sp.]|nr:hypothetical protein [Nitrosarchaeum sp.]
MTNQAEIEYELTVKQRKIDAKNHMKQAHKFMNGEYQIPMAETLPRPVKTNK